MGYWQFIFWTAGFTGTREGLSPAQFAALARLVRELRPARVHHGSCVGADTAMHRLCVRAGIPVTVHPPDRDRFRAVCGAGPLDEVREPKGYLERDRDIAEESSYLVACPLGPESRHSGTWYTVRHARRIGRPVVAIFPDGRIEVDGMPDGG